MLSNSTGRTVQVLHVSTYDSRGAGRAAHRLNQGLQAIGASSQLLVQSKSSDDRRVITPRTKLEKRVAKLRPSFSQLPLNLYPKREPTDYYASWLPDTMHRQIRTLPADVINLHWLGDGCLDVQSLAKFQQPLVWTVHDMWAFTGGCHYSQGCDLYKRTCGTCPQLGSSMAQDLSRWQWHRKARIWKPLNLTIVSPSEWLAKCVRASSIFGNTRVDVIPNGIDPQRYRPLDRQVVRELLHLPQEKHLVLFGAMQATQDKRKGFNLLQAALDDLSETIWRDRLELVVFGSSQPQESIDLGFKTHYLGRFHDDVSLSLVYAAADVFVAPSVEDNLPNTVMEALACGTPCVAFNIGGMPDMIEHQRNGYLAEPYRVEDLAQGIVWVVEHQERHQGLCQYARHKVEREFTLEIQANQYLDLYTDILSQRGSLN
jgi:glycosyltransferase involved in cell wall biosynthesis